MNDHGKSDRPVVPAKRASRTLKEESCRRPFHRRCCARDGGCWPSGVGLRGQALKPPCAALAEDRRGERQGKGALDASGGDQEDVPEALGRGDLGRASLLKRRKGTGGIETGGPCFHPRDEPGGCPCYWPGGARRRGGVSLVCGSCTEREKASVDTATVHWARRPPGRERERAEAETEGTEYRCGARRRTGP